MDAYAILIKYVNDNFVYMIILKENKQSIHSHLTAIELVSVHIFLYSYFGSIIDRCICSDANRWIVMLSTLFFSYGG